MNYTLTLSQNQIEILINKYKEYEVISNNNYTLFRGKIKSSALSIYYTGKVLIQGKDACVLYSEICNLLDIKIDSDIELDDSFNEENEEIEIIKPTIGNDEVGTGDFFGPIVVVSACVNEDNYMKVRRLKVKDSKQLNDDKIITIALELLSFLPHTVTILNDTKYNEVINKPNMNMNKVKAILHNNVMNKFKTKYPEYKDVDIILDDFCGKDKYYEYLKMSKNVIENITFITKAENKYLSVACASIIARYYFLCEMMKYSEYIGFTLPKGAGTKVDEVASDIIREKGTVTLSSVAKLNFKNFDKARKILSKQK